MMYKKKRNVASGDVPDFGAIFMSNSVMKKECFRTKLFGLPAIFMSNNRTSKQAQSHDHILLIGLLRVNLHSRHRVLAKQDEDATHEPKLWRAQATQ
ncbi:hypothetical protein Droror1_Dr00017910, partial [Drosera rotundifolia]